MYDETHQIQVAWITKCDLYAHSSLFAGVPISADVHELECYTGKPRMYYAHSSFFALLYFGANISRRTWYKGKPRMYDETHQVQITLITKCGLYAHGSLFALL